MKHFICMSLTWKDFFTSITVYVLNAFAHSGAIRTFDTAQNFEMYSCNKRWAVSIKLHWYEQSISQHMDSLWHVFLLQLKERYVFWYVWEKLAFQTSLLTLHLQTLLLRFLKSQIYGLFQVSIHNIWRFASYHFCSSSTQNIANSFIVINRYWLLNSLSMRCLQIGSLKVSFTQLQMFLFTANDIHNQWPDAEIVIVQKPYRTRTDSKRRQETALRACSWQNLWSDEHKKWLCFNFKQKMCLLYTFDLTIWILAETPLIWHLMDTLQNILKLCFLRCSTV